MQNPAAEKVFAAITGHWLARCVHVIAEAGIADHLGDMPEGPEMLAAKAGVDADALNRILRYLVSHGLFEAGPDGYSHNEASRLLRSDHPRSLRPYARMLGSEWQWQSFGALGHALATGQTGMSHVFGRESFDYLADHPADQVVFNQAMASRSGLDLDAVVAAGDFGRFAVIADIGGGNGSLLKAVLASAPGSRGVLFDLPHVAAQSSLAGDPRVTIAAGSFFDDPLPAADAYLLRRVIHDWRDEASLAILKAVRRAAAPGARLILIEAPLPDGNEPHPGKGSDIVMLTVVGGRERRVAEYRSLMEGGGFRWVGVRPTPTGTALIEGEAA